jgi:uncharacterized RDD family membrane protein YckC
MPQGEPAPDQPGGVPDSGGPGGATPGGATPHSGTPGGVTPGGATPGGGGLSGAAPQDGGPATGLQNQPGAQWRPEWGAGPRHGRGGSPVPRQLTRITGRRIVQYIIDSFLAGLIPGILFSLVYNYTHGVVKGLTWLIAVGVWIVIMLWYWVARPRGHNGQTFGMQWLGIRVVSKDDGGPASTGQLATRWIGLIFDSWLLTPIVGFIVILCSRYRQRIGDHMAGTLVVRQHGGYGSATAWNQESFASTADGTGTAGTGGTTRPAASEGTPG